MPDNTFGTISSDKKTVGHSTQPFVETCKRRKFNDDILYKQQQQKLEKTLYQHQQQLSDMTKNEMSFTNTPTSHTIEKTVSSSNESSLLLPTTLSREFYGRLIRKIFWVSFFCARVKDIFWVIFSHKAFFIIAGAINLVSIFSLVVQTFLYESKTHCSSCRVKQVQPHNQNQDQNQNSGQKKNETQKNQSESICKHILCLKLLRFAAIAIAFGDIFFFLARFPLIDETLLNIFALIMFSAVQVSLSLRHSNSNSILHKIHEKIKARWGNSSTPITTTNNIHSTGDVSHRNDNNINSSSNNNNSDKTLIMKKSNMTKLPTFSSSASSSSFKLSYQNCSINSSHGAQDLQKEDVNQPLTMSDSQGSATTATTTTTTNSKSISWLYVGLQGFYTIVLVALTALIYMSGSPLSASFIGLVVAALFYFIVTVPISLASAFSTLGYLPSKAAAKRLCIGMILFVVLGDSLVVLNSIDFLSFSPLTRRLITCLVWLIYPLGLYSIVDSHQHL